MADTDLLNPNQRRHFEVLFSMLEDELVRIERLATERGPIDRSLTIVEDDLPPDFADRARPILDDVRRHIRELSPRLHLGARRVSRRRSITARLTAAVIRLDDSSPQQLLGYGSVDARFIDRVTPSLAAIRASLVALSSMLTERPKAGSQEP